MRFVTKPRAILDPKTSHSESRTKRSGKNLGMHRFIADDYVPEKRLLKIRKRDGLKKLEIQQVNLSQTFMPLLRRPSPRSGTAWSVGDEIECGLTVSASDLA